MEQSKLDKRELIEFVKKIATIIIKSWDNCQINLLLLVIFFGFPMKSENKL